MREAILYLVGGAAALAFAASILFLRTRNLFYDALALAVTEVGLLFLAANLAGSVIWGRVKAGVWWTWDAGLTAALVCGLLYAAYLMLRQAMEEHTQRATSAAVFSILAFLDVPIVMVTIQWWCARRPLAAAPAWPASWNALAAWNVLAVLLPGVALTVIRLRREERRRQQDAQRRAAHAL